MTDVLEQIVNWLWAIVLALGGLVYRSFNRRIEELEAHNGAEAQRNTAAHQRLYDKIEALRLENKADHREARLDIVGRLDALSKQMMERDALATKLVSTLRGDSRD